MTWTTLLFVASTLSATTLAGPDGAVSESRHLGAAPSQASCTVTTTSEPRFVAPAPYPSSAPYPGNFWHGHDKLWTMLQVDGRWQSLPRNENGLRQKVFWWSPGFDGRVEAGPNLFVSGRRLDGPESFVRLTPATNAHHADFGGSTILTAIDLPAAGCWELTGTYHGESVTFVVSVHDRPNP